MLYRARKYMAYSVKLKVLNTFPFYTGGGGTTPNLINQIISKEWKTSEAK